MPSAIRLPPLRGRVGERVQAAALKQTLLEKRKLSPLPNPLPREREQITAPSTFSDGIGKENLSMNAFNLIIIGDEILHGSRQDKHFAFFKSLLESRGLKLNQVQYLPDEPDLLVKQLRCSFSDGLPKNPATAWPQSSQTAKKTA